MKLPATVNQWCLVLTALLEIGFVLLPSSQATEPGFAPYMLGQSQGEARITVTWRKQRKLPCLLTVEPNEIGEGRIGNAILSKGQLKRRKSDNIVVGDLIGPFTATKTIAGARVAMPFEFRWQPVHRTVTCEWQEARRPKTGKTQRCGTGINQTMTRSNKLATAEHPIDCDHQAPTLCLSQAHS